VRLRRFGRGLDLFERDIGTSEGDVVSHGIGEQDRFLRDDAYLLAQARQGYLPDINAIYRDLALLGVIEDLPDPVLPNTATIWPGSISRFRCLSTCVVALSSKAKDTS